ncbi:MAG: biopolymer transporter ExbD [Bacteroidales bacterium]|nr:biopolymer transporter ExbD [Bacteroidales bacterium]
MSKFRKGEKKEVGAISTASLPDIVFMLLFFFMVTTVMREVDVQVENTLPEATEITKLEDKALVSYIYIGRRRGASENELPKIQLNDAFASVEQIKSYVTGKVALIPEVDKKKMTVSLKIDKSTKMGIVSEVKIKLREAKAFKISYAAFETSEIE